MTRRQNDDDRMHWESAAEDAVEAALDEAEFDEIRRVVVLPGPEGPFRDVYEFSDVEELRQHLEEIYDTEWYANVPFDSGEAVFDSDADGFVSDHVADRGIESFFYDIRDPEDTVPIIGSDELVADANRSRILRIDMQEINAELIRYLARNPQFMRELNPRKFEELVAELFRDKGYEVELTPRSRDGGLDIIAVERSDLGSALTL